MFKFESLVQYHKKIKDLLDVYNVDLVVCGRPVRYFNTLKMHFAMLTLIEYEAEKRWIQFETVLDSQCKKLVLGNWRATKDDVMEWSGIDHPDISDAALFSKYMEKLLQAESKSEARA